MTPQEATKLIKELYYEEDYCLVPELAEALDLAIKALKRQIPKKPIITDFFDSGCCPNCERCISWIKNEYFDFDNCPYCGQAIDWSEE